MHFLFLGNIGNVFNIGSDGLIVTSGNVDRETRSRYILTVQVRCVHISKQLNFNNAFLMVRLLRQTVIVMH